MTQISINDLKNNPFIVADVTGYCSIFDFCVDKTPEEMLKCAEEKRTEKIQRYKELAEQYPSADKYWLKQAEAAKNAKYEIIRYNDFDKRRAENITSQPIQEITEDRFFEMLEVLPPIVNNRGDGLYQFMVDEPVCGTWYTQCAKINGKFYEKMVNKYDRSTWISELIKNGHEIKPLQEN